jgi:hypothetical protein
MKRIILLICISLCSYYSYSQTWPWARSGNGSSPITIASDCQALCNDPSGNVIIGGIYYGPGSNYAQLSFGSVSLTPVVNSAFYLAKYDKSGNLQWAKNSSEIPAAMYLRGIASDPSGNIFIVGDWGGSSSLVFGTSTLTTIGTYLFKCNPSGNVIWSKSFLGGASWNVTSDQFGNSYVTGWLGGTMILGTYTLNPIGAESIFVVKFDAIGNVVWARRDGGDGMDEPYSIATDNSGNVIIGGFSQGGTFFSAGSFTFTNPNPSTDDAFVVKYNNLGNVVWARIISGVGWEEIRSVTADPSGNVFATGWFSTASLVIGTNTLSNPTGIDQFFVVKYDPNGNVLWARSDASGGKSCGSSIKSDPYGNTWVAGDFSGTMVINTTSVITSGTAFLIEFDPSGNVICSTGIDQGGEFRNCVAVDTNDIYFASTCGVPSWNPNFVIGTNTLSPIPGNGVPFVAKFNCSTSTGINEVNSENFSSLVYPNPNSGLFKLKIENSIDGEIIIFNVTGQKVYSQKIKFEENYIATKDLSKGIYFYEILDKNRKVAKGKFIID